MVTLRHPFATNGLQNPIVGKNHQHVDRNFHLKIIRLISGHETNGQFVMPENSVGTA
jgi:hypothetical protein